MESWKIGVIVTAVVVAAAAIGLILGLVVFKSSAAEESATEGENVPVATQGPGVDFPLRVVVQDGSTVIDDSTVRYLSTTVFATASASNEFGTTLSGIPADATMSTMLPTIEFANGEQQTVEWATGDTVQFFINSPSAGALQQFCRFQRFDAAANPNYTFPLSLAITDGGVTIASYDALYFGSVPVIDLPSDATDSKYTFTVNGLPAGRTATAQPNSVVLANGSPVEMTFVATVPIQVSVTDGSGGSSVFFTVRAFTSNIL